MAGENLRGNVFWKGQIETSSGETEQNPRARTLLLVGPHFYGEENWSPERLSNLPIVTQLIYGRARICI